MPQVNVGYPALEGDAIDAIVDATVQVAAQRLSGDLSVAETERLRDRTGQMLAAAERLHAYPLSNADEPAFVLGLSGISA